MRARLGWLGPIVVVVGLVVGGVGVWWMARSRPTPGPFVDLIAVGDRGAIAVRAEGGGTRNFVELIELGVGARWQALVPPYAGTPQAPGLTVTQRLVNARVVRDGRDEVFTVALVDAVKVGGARLTEAWPQAPGGHTVPTVVSVDGVFHTYEVVGDATRHAVIALSRTDGLAAWRHEGTGAIVDAFEVGAKLALVNPDGAVVLLDAATGAIDPAATAAHAGERVPVPAAEGAPYDLTDPTLRGAAALGDAEATAALATQPRLRFDPGARTLSVEGGAPIAWPPDALAPRPHHLAGAVGLLWMVWPDRVAAVDARTLATRWSSGAPPTWPDGVRR
ncbi:MAG: hypothetical protein R2939_02130 [Kofleriaceae bacterium]